jgi:hypothetical protein
MTENTMAGLGIESLFDFNYRFSFRIKKHSSQVHCIEANKQQSNVQSASVLSLLIANRTPPQ